MTREEAIEILRDTPIDIRSAREDDIHTLYATAQNMAIEALSADAVQGWIPCSERLPKINQSVLLATNGGVVFIGHRDKPELIWQVTEEDGRKHWVYDPEAYTDDIESLPKGEDCGFDNESRYEEGVLSVTSANYNPRFVGVIAWMPLPEPYKVDTPQTEREGE